MPKPGALRKVQKQEFWTCNITNFDIKKKLNWFFCASFILYNVGSPADPEYKRFLENYSCDEEKSMANPETLLGEIEAKTRELIGTAPRSQIVVVYIYICICVYIYLYIYKLWFIFASFVNSKTHHTTVGVHKKQENWETGTNELNTCCSGPINVIMRTKLNWTPGFGAEDKRGEEGGAQEARTGKKATEGGGKAEATGGGAAQTQGGREAEEIVWERHQNQGNLQSLSHDCCVWCESCKIHWRLFCLLHCRSSLKRATRTMTWIPTA